MARYASSVSVRQVAACAVLVAAWAMLVLNDQGVFDGAPRGHTADAALLLALVLAVGVGVYVGRWAVVGLAATPVVVLSLLEAGYVEPFHGSTSPLSEWVWWIAFCALPLAFGVLVRKRGLVPWPPPPRAPTPR